MLSQAIFIVSCALISIAYGQSCSSSQYPIGNGNISSPNYPENYDNRLDCVYLLQATNNSTILITFDSFDTEGCCDILNIYDGNDVRSPLLLRLSGIQDGVSCQSTSQFMTLHFTSDATINRKGFHASYQSAPIPSSSTAPSSLTIVDWRNLTTNYNARTGPVSMIVLHHTVTPTAIDTLNILNDRGLSVTYIADRDGTIYYMVDESHRAYHAGAGTWTNFTDVNGVSIGIEIVNTGDEPFPAAQVSAVAELCREIVDRYPTRIVPKMIVGHADFAPTRKQDPSGYFDWRSFYSIMGIYPLLYNTHLSSEQQRQVLFQTSTNVDSGVRALQQQLTTYGYSFAANQIDGIYGPYTGSVVQAFNRHFCQEVFYLETIVNDTSILDERNTRWYRLSQERLDYLVQSSRK